MSKLIDLTNLRFGHLTVIKKDPIKSDAGARWICQCDCGAICSKLSASLRKGEATCCDRYKCIFAPKRYIDLTNKQFGRLTVLYITDEMQKNEHIWHCKCECGNEYDVTGVALREGYTRSCGCLKQESDKSPKGNVKDEVGNKYGHLTVVARAGSDKNGAATWECECDCELKTHIIVLGNNLRRGHTTSCGCDRRSKGEKKIIELLIRNQIPFIAEYKFPNFSNFRFDFYVDNKYLIEYDGETHYQYNMHGWHNKEQLQKQIERDKIKNQFCIDNNIPLIRISFTRYDKLCIDDLKLETTNFLISNNQ